MIKICGMVDNIALLFEGRYGQDNAELIKMKNEVLYGPLPTAYEDRRNLKKDGQKVVNDLVHLLTNTRKNSKPSQR